MKIVDICEDLFNDSFADNEIKVCLSNYFNQSILDEIYFLPKKVDKDLIGQKLSDEEYLGKVRNALIFYRNVDVVQMISKRFHDFEIDTGNTLDDEIIYLIIGLDTSTIYSTNYNGRSITVLLLEATNGDLDNLNMLLAHEYTHFIRKRLLNKNIFTESIGERFITEGIASNYSREIVPTKRDEDYCIVPYSTVIWVENNMGFLDDLVKKHLDSNGLLELFFNMNINTKIEGMPVRTGYVYGYFKVRNYLDRYNLKVKDILGVDWSKILVE